MKLGEWLKEHGFSCRISVKYYIANDGECRFYASCIIQQSKPDYFGACFEGFGEYPELSTDHVAEHGAGSDTFEDAISVLFRSIGGKQFSFDKDSICPSCGHKSDTQEKIQITIPIDLEL